MSLMPDAPEPLLEVEDLAVTFEGVAAVDGASLSVYAGQTLAIVGESGCGKSMTALSVLGLIPPPGHMERGRIIFDGRDLSRLPPADLRRVRGREIAMIFQEPMTSLNPVMTIGEQIIEAARLHRTRRLAEARAIAVEALREVGIPDPVSRLIAYPHEFSGGMRQRVMIAMALACRPRLLLADEPTTALDVTIQQQVLDLLESLQRSRSMGLILITHDLGVVAQHADVVCVMYAGRVVEYARTAVIFDRPLHPYTRGLLQSIPVVGRRRNRLTTVDEITSRPEEFHDVGVRDVRGVPWWPATARNAVGDSPARNASGGVLLEVEPEHWVGCRADREALATPTRPPRIPVRARSALIESR